MQTTANIRTYDRLAEYKSTEKTADDGIQSVFFVILYFDARRGYFRRLIMVAFVHTYTTIKKHRYIIHI